MIKATMEVTFNFFKKLCFDSWRFKNLVLACDEYIVIDYVKKYYAIEVNASGEVHGDEDILGKIMNVIDSLKLEAEKANEGRKQHLDPRLDDVFLPAMNALMVIVFLSIGNKRVRLHKEKVVTLKAAMKKNIDENYEVNGQIKLLEDLKNRILRERGIEAKKST